MKKVLLVIISLALIFVVVRLLQTEEYETLDDLEKLFKKYDLAYTTKPMEKEYILMNAKEQKIYVIKDTDIFVYTVKEADLESADFIVSNDFFPKHTVATVNGFVFAYSDENEINFQKKLYEVIEEIRESKK